MTRIEPVPSPKPEAEGPISFDSTATKLFDPRVSDTARIILVGDVPAWKRGDFTLNAAHFLGGFGYTPNGDKSKITLLFFGSP